MITDDMIEAMLKKKERQRIAEAAHDAARSGGISGSIIGALGGAIEQGGSWRNMLAKAALGGAGGAAVGGLGTYLGSQVLGAPEEGEKGGYTSRAGLGGALAGGALGAGFGGLLGAGKLGWLKKVPGTGRLAQQAADTMVGKGVKALLHNPGASKRTALALGLGGALGGGAYGGGEGMQLDYLNSLEDDDGLA